jgi:uncharacterized protein YecT (DUF1311 family)
MKHLLLLMLFLACSASAQDLQKAKAAYAKADKELNAAWADLKKALSESEFAAMQEDQRSWLQYRDYLARSPLFNGVKAPGDLPLDSPVYLESAAALTETRAQWLRGWLRFKDDTTLTGIWEDSYGGTVKVVEKDGKLTFGIDVHRGQSIHSGDISGVAAWNSPVGWYSDKKENGPAKEGGETNLAFILRGRILEIIGANTSHYHGARAYFDGRYIKVAALDAKAQAELIKAAVSE